MAKLMQSLEHGEDQVERKEIVEGQYAVREIVGQIRPMWRNEKERRQDHRTPHKGPPPAPHEPYQPVVSIEECIWVPEPEPDGHGIGIGLTVALSLLPLTTGKQLSHVRGHVRLQQIGRVQLADQMNH